MFQIKCSISINISHSNIFFFNLQASLWCGCSSSLCYTSTQWPCPETCYHLQRNLNIQRSSSLTTNLYRYRSLLEHCVYTSSLLLLKLPCIPETLHIFPIALSSTFNFFLSQLRQHGPSFQTPLTASSSQLDPLYSFVLKWHEPNHAIQMLAFYSPIRRLTNVHEGSHTITRMTAITNPWSSSLSQLSKWLGNLSSFPMSALFRAPASLPSCLF